MRFAIAALMTFLLIGTIFAQDAQTAQDQTSLDQPAQDQTVLDQPAQDQTGLDQPAPDQTVQDQNAPDTANTQTTTPAPVKNPPTVPTKETPKSKLAFAGGINLGSDVLLSGAGNSPETWTRFGFQPDLSYGKVGIGFDLTFHFMLYKTQDTAFTLYPGDWVPNYNGNGKTVFDVYLPKIMYVRYGLKGEDPFFAKLGSINDLSLGNGFIMSNYSNMLFLPQQRIFGLDLGLDGSLFNFPFVGLEALTGNLAQLDVVGGRVFARPLVSTSIPILKNMQVGATIVADTNPDLYSTTGAAAKTIAAYGADIAVPILGGKVFPLVAFTDLAIDPNQTTGWMIGFGGRLISVFTYGAQLRVLQNGFIPSYFDANYDIFRAKKYVFMQLTPSTGTYYGWNASLGTSLFTDKFVFNTTMDGPFTVKGVVANPSVNANQVDYPHLRGVLRLNQIDKFPFFFDASYDKYLIGAKTGFFQDLVDPTDAVIGLNVNYKTGASVLTLAYNAKWNPLTSQFDVTSSLQVSMKF